MRAVVWMEQIPADGSDVSMEENEQNEEDWWDWSDSEGEFDAKHPV